jgi:hypothetical protein
MTYIRLDLGAQDVSPPGFTPMGRYHGSEIFPLQMDDERSTKSAPATSWSTFRPLRSRK